MIGILEILTSEYGIHLAILTSVYLILAQSLNLTLGFGQLFNLAHVASYAIGAYATALLSTESGASFALCLCMSMILSGVFALALGGIALRLSSDYFAIGTIAFSSLISALLINWKSFTHGVLGIPGIPRPEILGIDLYNNLNFLLLILVFVFFSHIFFLLLYKSWFGRSLRALAEYEDAALALGHNTRLIRNVAFCFSSVGAGLAGSFFAYYLNYIDPSSFSLGEMIFVLTIVIVGRPGSFWGVTGATLFLVLLPEPLRFLDIPSAYVGPVRQLIHAAILFGVIYWKRRTLFPEQRQV
jgi:branched-chain amino acid transport system permease protein